MLNSRSIYFFSNFAVYLNSTGVNSILLSVIARVCQELCGAKPEAISH
jgi:hypothetical protein